MQIETVKRYQLSREEVEIAIRKYLGIDSNMETESFSLRSEVLADPQPVAFLTVKGDWDSGGTVKDL